MKVLMVDDDKIGSNSVLENLEIEEIETKLISNIIEFEMVKNEELNSIDFIIMDYNLEDIHNGIQLYTKLQVKFPEQFKRINKIFFSGNGNYIPLNELNFLKQNSIKIFSKNESDEMIDFIIES